MSTKPRKPRAPAADADPAPVSDTDSTSASANNIWFAGLGALAKAQAEGSKAFEALVHEGVAAQRAAHDAAQQRMEAFTQRVEAINQDVTRAAGRWPGLESIFENRVSRALEAMGMPSAQAWSELTARVAALERAMATGSTPDAAAQGQGTPSKRANRKPRPSN